MRPILAIAILIFLLGACAPVQPAALPTASPSAASSASATPTPTATTSSIPATNTPTPLAEPERILITAPGPQSQVISPIQLLAQLQPGAGGLVRIELAGSDGRLLARTLLRMDGSRLAYAIPFEVRAAERGRLSLSVADEYGRLRELASVALTLLPADGEQIIRPADPEPSLIIASPQPGASLSGGVLEVSGQLSGSSPRPLTIQALTRDGRVLAATDVFLEAGSANGSREFTAEVTVAVEEESWVLLTVSRSGGEIPGLWFLESREVRLLP